MKKITVILVSFSALFLSCEALIGENKIDWTAVSKWQKQHSDVEKTLSEIFRSSDTYEKLGDPSGLAGYTKDDLKDIDDNERSIDYF